MSPAAASRARSGEAALPEVALENPLAEDAAPDFEVQFQAGKKEPQAASSQQKSTPHSQLENSVLDALVGAENMRDTLDSEVEALFDAAIQKGGGEPALGESSRPDELDAMFETMVAMHLRPVRDLMLEVRWGTAPSSWIAHCRVALKTVQEAAGQVDRPDLQKQLDKLSSVLDSAAKAGRAEISEAFKGPLLSAYEPISKLAPKELSLEDEHGRREPVLVRSLLLQAKDVEHVTLGKLFGAGLSTMQGLLQASADDMSMTANVPQHLSNRIVRQVDDYKDTFGTTTASIDKSRELSRLRSVFKELSGTQNKLLEASRGWSDDAVRQKRQLQKERAQLLLQIAVVMARLGETNLLKEMERSSIEARIRKLDEFLSGQTAVSPQAQARQQP